MTNSFKSRSWRHKKKLIFRNQELVPIINFYGGDCTSSAGAPLSQESFYTNPVYYLPYYTTQKTPQEVDRLRLSVNKFWTRSKINTTASYGDFDAARHYSERMSTAPGLAYRLANPSVPQSNPFDELGHGICFTDDRPFNEQAPNRNQNTPNLQAHVIPVSRLLDENYFSFPWTSRISSPPASNQTFLSRQREKYTIQVTPPLTPKNLEPGSALQNFDTLGASTIPEWWKDNTQWANFVSESFNHQSYEDLSFSMWVPFEDKDIDPGEVNYSHSIRDVHVKINPSYNFYIKSYEDVISEPAIPENILPNLYVFGSEFDNRFEDADNSRFKQLIDLMDSQGVSHIEEMFVDVIGPNGRKIGEKDEGQYFERWADKIQQVDEPINVFSNLVRQYKNIAFASDNNGVLSSHEGAEALFPMHIELDFVTDIQTKVADSMNDTQLFPILLQELHRLFGMIGSHADELGSLYSYQYWSEVSTQMCEYVNKFQSSRTADIGEWINFISNPAEFQNEFGSLLADLDDGGAITFLGRVREQLDSLVDPSNALSIMMKMSLFASEIVKLVEPTSNQGHFRSYKELLQGKEAYSETLLYRIEKVDATNPDRTIQNFWFPNSSKLDTIKYIDTQVKYNKNYRYKIWAYQLVVGNTYEYQVNKIGGMSNSQVSSPYGNTYIAPYKFGDFLARLCVFNEPNLKLIEVPYYDTKIDYPEGIAVVDNPPVRPDINLIPYKDTGNKILLWMNGSVGNYWEEPISILASDDFSEMLRLHGRDTNNNDNPNEVEFKSDDHVTQFEVFELEHRPRLYTEFAQGRRTLLSAANGSTSADFILDIKSNKKYYYTFRAIDNHGHMSNPTSVYECEIVQDNENIFSLINVIDMDVDVGRQVTKSGRKFLEIKPAFLQSRLNESTLSSDVKSIISDDQGWSFQDAQGNGVVPRLGEGQQSIWGLPSDGRKFKIRLTSTKSSKKLDLNVKFRTVQTKDEN